MDYHSKLEPVKPEELMVLTTLFVQLDSRNRLKGIGKLSTLLEEQLRDTLHEDDVDIDNLYSEV